MAKRCGQVLALGVPLEPVYPFDYNHFFRQNLHLIASVTPPDETYMIRAAELVARHEQELAWLITHRYAMDEAAQAFTLYETRSSGRPLKILLDGANWPLGVDQEGKE